MQKHCTRPTSRRASAVVELAVSLPVLTLVVLGSIEMSQVVFVKQSLSVTAHECGKIASRRDATNADVASRADEIFDQRGLVQASVVSTPSNIEGLPRGTRITVRSTANNSSALLKYFTSPTIESHCVVVKEI